MVRIITLSLYILLTVNLFAQGFIPFNDLNLNKYIEGINEKTCYSLPNSDEWKVEFFKSDSCYSTVNIHLDSKDTTYQIFFLVSKNEDYKIVSFSKGYECNDYVYLLEIENCNDTSYYCKFPKTKRSEKYYYVGKYRDMFKQFTLKQMNYYVKYKDSLMYVRGNNLPPLPEIDLVEDDYNMNLNILLGKDFYYPKIHDKKNDYCDKDNW